MAVLFLVGHEQLHHLVPRAGKVVQAAGGDGSTQLVERQRGAENLDSFTQPRVTTKAFREPTLGLHLVHEVVEYFVLFLQGLQHGPDFVELGPRDGGVQRFALSLFHGLRSLKAIQFALLFGAWNARYSAARDRLAHQTLGSHFEHVSTTESAAIG